MKLRPNTAALASAAAMLLCACTGGRQSSVTAPPDFASQFSTTHFLQFLNHQPSLAAGTYTLVAGTQQPAQSGGFTLSATFDNGSKQTFTGAWTSSGGASATAAGNPSFPVTLKVAGGLQVSLTASVATHVYLVDQAGNVLADNGAAGGATSSALNLPASQTDAPSYPAAYYQAVDPGNTRDSLDKWKQANGFGGGDTAHVIFRDRIDLGYGRDMHMLRRADGGIAIYVQNFQVNNVPGQEYGALNLQAAIDQDPQYHLNTNAIEWGPIHDASGNPVDLNGDGTIDQSDYLAQFYTFDPQSHARKTFVDMDGEGDKAMPVPCIVCHGGRADLLLPDGSYPRQGDLKAHLQPLDLSIFDFSTQAPYRRTDEEAALKTINQAVYDSYAASLGASSNGTPTPVAWNSAQARALLESWYGGAGMPSATFIGEVPPVGWTPDPTLPSAPPAGADQLYRDVEGAYCRSCHLLRGTDGQSDIDFSTFSKFVGFAPLIQTRVFDQGYMPLAVLQTDLFYASQSLPQELASFLPGFTDYGPQGTVNFPGRPIADAGPPYTGPSPMYPSGAASSFAGQYQWSVVSSPAGSAATFDDPTSVRPLFSASMDGVYVLQLVVGLNGAQSAPATTTITIDGSVPKAPSALTFDADIKPVMQTVCTVCHSPTTANAYIPPVYYTDPSPGENRNLYQDVRERLNLVDPVRSLILTKPTGMHHGGNVVPGFDLSSAQHANYDLFLAWIAAGAREK